MTRDEIEAIGRGDLNAMAKLAATIKPLEKSGRAPGPVLRQFTKAEEIPDFIPPGTGISGPTDHTQLAPRRSTTSTRSPIDPDSHGTFTVNIGNDLDEQGYGLTGNYAEVRGQIDEYNRECQARFRSVIQQLYPTLPGLWNLPAPASGEAPPRWGLERAARYDDDRREKARYQRIAADETNKRSIRKGAADVVMGLEVQDPRMKNAIAKHNANLAAREAMRTVGGTQADREALAVLAASDDVPAAVREQARRELRSLE